MRIFSPVMLYRWFLALCLAGIVSGQVSAQSPTARAIDPSVLDPQYDLRKQRLISPSSRVVAATRPAPTKGLAPQLPACFEPLDSVSAPGAGGYINLPRNDDGSSVLIPLGFTFTLFGTPYTGVYINTNGNLSFGAPVDLFSASGFPIDIPMVAGFWADVDTRPASSGSIWYKLYSDRLVVTWNRVGYFDGRTDKKNTFQIVIRANSTGATTDDVTFAYGDMQWTTGDASSGTNGFGGSLATVGVNRGSNNDFIQTGRFNLDNSIRTDNVSPSGVNWLDEQCISYRVFTQGNLPPSATNLPLNNTITVNQGQTVSIAPQFSGPEAGQAITLAVNTNGLCNVNSSVGPGINPVLNLSVTGAACNIGTNVIRVVATDNGTPVASRQFDITVIVNPPATASGITWTGAIDRSWINSGNWNPAQVPTATDNVSIPDVPNDPIVSTTQQVNSLTLGSGATLTTADGSQLTLNGNFANSGGSVLGTGNGEFRFSGSTAQTISGTSTTFHNLTAGPAGVTANAPVQVQRVLLLNGTFTSNGNLTLLSNATGTAHVVNNGAGVVSGRATVQRYIDGSRNGGSGYRHYSAPVSVSTVADLATSGFSPVVNPAYNTATVPAAVTPFPTVFGYREARVTTSGNPAPQDFDRGFLSPNATTDTLQVTRGYTVNIPASQTVDFVGTLNNGTYTAGGLSRGTQPESGWHLRGNPYPSPIDWELVVRNNMDATVYVYRSEGPYAGTYSTYTVNGPGTNGGERRIASGQGFFVRASFAGTTNGSLTFNNTARYTTYENPVFQRGADSAPLVRLDLRNTAGAADEAVVYFEAAATAGFDAQLDAHKLQGGSSLLLASEAPAGTLLAVNALPQLSQRDVLVPLRVHGAAGSYTLRATELLRLPAGIFAYLRDAQTGTVTDLASQPEYRFSVAAGASATGRFSVLLTQQRVLSNAATLAGQLIQLYPNPAHTTATLLLPATLRSQPGTAVLYNALGQAVRTYSWLPGAAGTPQVLSVSGLTQGVYTLRLATASGPATKRLVIE